MNKEKHLSEVRIALDADDPRHILPPALPGAQRVLDIGCGAGQTLIAAYRDRVTFGLDIDIEALKLGRSLTEKVHFLCGRAEELPYGNERFDLVIARVSLPYTKIGVSLREIRRVLKIGGTVWMTLHPFSMSWNRVRSSRLKSKLSLGYILLNSVLFHVFQRQFQVFGKCESYQTERGITRALCCSGFGDVSISRGKHFAVTARAI